MELGTLLTSIYFTLAERDEEEDEERDAMVEYLFEQVKELRVALLESEMRNATLEADVREEVVQEMQEQLKEMNEAFRRRLQDEVRNRSVSISSIYLTSLSISVCCSRREDGSKARYATKPNRCQSRRGYIFPSDDTR